MHVGLLARVYECLHMCAHLLSISVFLSVWRARGTAPGAFL